jgi:hypothetical protein
MPRGSVAVTSCRVTSERPHDRFGPRKTATLLDCSEPSEPSRAIPSDHPATVFRPSATEEPWLSTENNRGLGTHDSQSIHSERIQSVYSVRSSRYCSSSIWMPRSTIASVTKRLV